MKPIEIFDGKTRKRLAFLQNAHAISYTKKINSLWTGSFRLPYSDDKKIFCKSFNLVKMWDVDHNGKDVEVGLFRIIPQTHNPIGGEAYIEYQLEHVLAFLIDDVMEGWHQYGGSYTTQGTPYAIVYILSHQEIPRWTISKCAYWFGFMYGWQDENLLSALLSIPKPFLKSDYIWEYDTNVYPWRISLVKVNSTPVADIRYRKNLTGFKKITDPTKVVTRLYCYGFGQGENRLDIRSINNNLAYLDSPNSSEYGTISQVWVDESCTDQETLKATGASILNRLDKEAVSYEFETAYHSSPAFKIGEGVRIVHDTMDEKMLVQSISKSDVSGKPREATVVFGNGTVDAADSFASVAERQKINEVYSQGAESLFADSLADNADPDNPLEIMFNVPESAVHVNDLRVTIKLEKFRAYSKGANEGGSYTSTGENDPPPQEERTTELSTTTLFTSSGMVDEDGNEYDGKERPIWDAVLYHTGNTSPIRSGGTTDPHKHDLKYHYHSLKHQHKIEIPAHSHPIKHVPHKHPIDIPPHEHTLKFGIYLGPKATGMEIFLDGKSLGTFGDSVTNLDLIEKMNKINGKIERGQHTIRIKPNDLSRIECMFQIRLFTNALGNKQF